MKYKVCDKCGEIVARTGIISSSRVSDEKSCYARCNNKNCQQYYSKIKYERLKEEEFWWNVEEKELTPEEAEDIMVKKLAYLFLEQIKQKNDEKAGYLSRLCQFHFLA